MQRNGGSGSLQASQEEYDVSYKVRKDAKNTEISHPIKVIKHI